MPKNRPLACLVTAICLLLAAAAAGAQVIKLEPKYFKVDELMLESGQSIDVHTFAKSDRPLQEALKL